MAKPLIVNVLELLRRPGSTKDVDATVAMADIEFGDDRVADKPVRVNVHLESLTDGIAVAGTVHATWHGECRRCLLSVERDMDVAVTELYQVVVQDPDAHPIELDQINLLPMVRENVLLALPLAPLCTESCAGLCPTCGANRNEMPCTCAAPAADNRWDALDDLRSRLSDAPEG